MFDIFKIKNNIFDNKYKNNKYKSTGCEGFSLIEMAVVLAITGVIAAGGLVMGSAKHEQNKFITTNNRLSEIEDALERHVKTIGYLPCPAEVDATIATASFGAATDCSVAAAGSIVAVGTGNEEIRIGAVPTRALNLPSSYAFDGWGNRFNYAMVTELAKTSDAYDDYTTTVTNNVIEILDKNGNQIPDADKDIVVAFAVYSHGKDGKGSYNKVGNQVISCDATQADGENCDDDDVFVDMQYLDSEIKANYSDDLIKWRVRHTLKDVVLAITKQ